MRRTPITNAGIDRRTLLAGSVAGMLLSSRSKAASANTLTLRVSATPSIFKPMFLRLCQEFQRRHPRIGVDLSASARGADDQIQGTLRSSLIGDLPDVSFEGLSYLSTLQRRRLSVPLDHWLRSDPDWNEATYGRSLVEGGSVGKTIVGLAVALSVPLIYYNTERLAPLLRAAPMPTNWDDILTLADRLDRASATTRFVGGYCRHAPGNWIYTALVESHGGMLMSPDEREILFDSAPGQRALNVYRRFGQAGQARANLAREQARQAFSAGGIGILVDSSSSLASFEKQIAGRFTLGTAPIPVASGGRIPVSGVAAVMLTRDLSRQEAAWSFIKFVAGPEGQRIIGESTGYFPGNERVIERADWLGDYYRNRPQVQAITASLAFAGRGHAFPGDNAAKIEAVIFDEVAAVISHKRTPEQALAIMRRDVQLLLPKRHA